jgi:hypothetical protein
MIQNRFHQDRTGGEIGVGENRHSLYRQAMASELTPEYVATLRLMTGRQKLRTAFALYWGARKIKAAALRQQHPDWNEEQVQQKVKEIFLHATT